MNIVTRKVHGTDEIIVTFKHGDDSTALKSTSSLSVFEARDEVQAVEVALKNREVRTFLNMTKDEIMAQDADTRLSDLLKSLSVVMSKITDLKDENPDLRLGHRMAFGAILNAYRECDLSFVEAVEQLKEVAKHEYGN